MADGWRFRWPQGPAPALAVALAALGTAVPVAAEQGAARRAWSDGGLNMTIRLRVAGERPIEGTLLDVPAARDFAALLPLTLTLTDYAATEKIGDLPRRLTTQGAPDGFEPKIGDIAFYAPWGNLAIFHKDFRHSPGLVRLGTISAGIQRFAVPGPMQVTIERTEKQVAPAAKGRRSDMKRELIAAALSTGLAGPALTEERAQIFPNGSLPSGMGPQANFTGSVRVDPQFAAPDQTPLSAGHVTFEPGARSAWHTHPAGQLLIVTSGAGWVQEENGRKREIKPGDVIWTPAGVKHWHGATAATGVSHFAIQNSVDGKNVDWMEKVSDDEYGK